jgi:hypothetical protein
MTEPADRRLIIVSNRVAMPKKKGRRKVQQRAALLSASWPR